MWIVILDSPRTTQVKGLGSWCIRPVAARTGSSHSANSGQISSTYNGLFGVSMTLSFCVCPCFQVVTRP